MFFEPFFLHSAQRFLSATRFKSASGIALSSWGSASSPLFSACKSAKVCLKFSGHGLPHRNSNSNYMKQGRRRRHTRCMKTGPPFLVATIESYYTNFHVIVLSSSLFQISKYHW